MQVIKPKVSVCVVTYNHRPYIRECLYSIVSQQVDFTFEVIVGDDCSTDGTSGVISEFVEKYPGVVKLVRHATNIGPTANYLSIHNLAHGEYVCHCDGDDFWLDGKLEKQVIFMDSNPAVVQSWHRQRVINQSSEPVGVFPRRYSKSVFGKLMGFGDLAHSYGLVGQHSSQMYRRSARTVHTREQPTIDYFFALDIASKGLSAHLPDFLGCYRIVRGGSVTQAESGRDMVDSCVMDAVAYFAELFPDSKPAFKANVYARAFGGFVRKRSHWRVMREAVSGYPTSILSMFRSFIVLAAHKI
ncbi:MAG: glycosyltransferase [Limisphaerales bacterium]